MYLKTLNILIAEWIKIPVQGLSPLLERKIHERLVFTNPDYEARNIRGEWLGSISPQINCLQKTSRHYLLPRGFLDQLIELCKKCQQPYRITDRRRLLEPAAIEFHGQLKDYQQEAAEAVFSKDFTTLVGGHKSGKTVIALYILAQRCQPALILIPKLELLGGWLNKIENFLQIPSAEVGLIVEGTCRVGKDITIAHTGEIARHWRAIRDQIGFLILDECQRCPSKVFTNIISKFDSRYMLGLANTTQRKDRLSKFIFYYIGDVIYSIDEKDAKEGRGIIHAHIVARTTDFDFPYHSRVDFTPMLDALMRDRHRNRVIAGDIEAQLRETPGPMLVLSGGEEQDEALRAELEKRGIAVVNYSAPPGEEGSEEECNPYGVDYGDDEEDVAPLVHESLSRGPVAVLMSPETFARCFRDFNAHVLFLTVPLFFRSRLAFAIRNLGASRRQSGNGPADRLDGPANRLKIYDYVDHRVGLLENYFRMRSYSYGVHPDVLLGRS